MSGNESSRSTSRSFMSASDVGGIGVGRLAALDVLPPAEAGGVALVEGVDGDLREVVARTPRERLHAQADVVVRRRVEELDHTGAREAVRQHARLLDDVNGEAHPEVGAFGELVV